ncbi:hypothetical protein BGZ60DRAFT_402205 [Tricladium varicosporioides]|nr:hypothetical protein BGZ60DRAFT_402205 [Hymenoscyphus varicosporioides]
MRRTIHRSSLSSDTLMVADFTIHQLALASSIQNGCSWDWPGSLWGRVPAYGLRFSIMDRRDLQNISSGGREDSARFPMWLGIASTKKIEWQSKGQLYGKRRKSVRTRGTVATRRRAVNRLNDVVSGRCEVRCVAWKTRWLHPLSIVNSFRRRTIRLHKTRGDLLYDSGTKRSTVTIRRQTIR